METVVKAGSVALLSTGVVLSALLLINLTQPLSLLEGTFEAFSAFGTVGLSMNATTDLDPLGRLIVIALMYLGRIGPLTFALALVQSPQADPLKYPDEGVLIG